jgi:hypothetical protein
MKIYNSWPAAGSVTPKTGAVALATAHYFLYELSHWRVGMLYKTNQPAERHRFRKFSNFKE